MKLNSLHIKNFRMLEDFTVQKLGRVNLIVGGNNSGKSTVLEALRIYAGNANLKLLKDIAISRHEKYEMDSTNVNDLPFEAFFSGRKFPNDETEEIEIGEISSIEKKITIGFFFIQRIEETIVKEIEGGKEEIKKTIEKSIYKSDLKQSDYNGIYPVFSILVRNNQVFIDFSTNKNKKPEYFSDSNEYIICNYIPTDLIEQQQLALYWDIVSATNAEEVINTLKFIEPNTEGISFIGKYNNPLLGKNSIYTPYTPYNNTLGLSPLSLISPTDRTAYIKLSNVTELVSLSSMGEGMSRILQLALYLNISKNGFLLIDEFENGLHWSVQEKVWDMVFTMAEKLDIQVFATTHSYDCIKAFSKSATKVAERDGVLFKMGYNKKLEKTVALEFSREELSNLSETMLSNATLEVR